MSKKPRGDSKLKTLPEEQQQQIIEWLRSKTQAATIALILEKFGLDTSSAALSEFYSWWHLSRRLEQVASFTDQLKSDLAQIPGLNLSSAQLSEAGQAIFEAMAIKENDPKLYTVLRGRRQYDRELALREREVVLKEDAFQVRTCELFLKWFSDAKAREIAEGNTTNSEKIRQMRQTYFADVDALEKSGTVELPQ